MSRAALKLVQEIESAPKAGPIFKHLSERFPLVAIRSESHHRHALGAMEKLILFLNGDQASASEREQVEEYAHSLSMLIDEYEKKSFSSVGKGVSGIDTLRILMKEHGLNQKDLEKELGGQSVVSKLLNGDRALNLRQIQALSERFNVSPMVFLDS